MMYNTSINTTLAKLRNEGDGMPIVKADSSNINQWIELSLRLFPDEDKLELKMLYNRYLNYQNLPQREIGFLYKKDAKYVGFINYSIKQDYVSGSTSSPVLYIEAIYVLPEYRNKGVGQKLIRHVEQVAKDKGIQQVASDCELYNKVSEQFHKNCGFKEVERVICFIKNV